MKMDVMLKNIWNWADNNHISGDFIPRDKHDLINLKKLNLSDKGLKEIPKEIGCLFNLTELHLYQNQLTSIPKEIANLSKLNGLYLSANNLTRLPIEIYHIFTLVEFAISENNFNEIPKEIGNLTNLTWLNLGTNNLMQIPDEIGNLINLKKLYLPQNRLEKLPESIGNLRSLVELHADFNKLKKLPCEMGQLTQLSVIDLKNNQLLELPKELVSCTNLDEIILDNNPLIKILGLEKTKDVATEFKNKEIIGTASGVIGSGGNYADNVILGASRGHGFAAEKANHLKDVFSGKDAKIVGGDNAKNGADRLVDGISIQTKYCKTGSKCIGECFESGELRYLNSDGSPMQIEVPSDLYDSAVQSMEDKIKKGQVPGVSDPEMAKEIVRKGAFTYEQARNIAKFGTVESLTYDAVNGIKLAGTAMGISAAISFAVNLWKGEDWDKALESSCYVGLNVGGVAWVSSIVTAQLGRTGVEQGLRGATDWVVKQMGPKASAWLANGLRSGKAIYGSAAMNHVSKLLRGNFVTGVVTTIVISSVDFVRLFQGRCSGAQLFKNFASTASGVAGGTGGWMAGAAGGAAVGSLVPIIGTAAGGVIGGLLGAFAGGTAASKAATAVLDEFIEDDAKEMLKIVEEEFGELAFNYLLSEEEAKSVLDEFQSNDVVDFLRDLYASINWDDEEMKGYADLAKMAEDYNGDSSLRVRYELKMRKKFIREEFQPMIENVVRNRKLVSLPTDEQLIQKTGQIIEALAT